MKIRLVGSADLVDAWCAELERAYSIKGAKYPSRNSNEKRVYFDLDDRKAADVVGLTNPIVMKDKAIVKRSVT